MPDDPRWPKTQETAERAHVAFGESGRPSGIDAFEELNARVRQLSLERRRLRRLLEAVVAISADMDTCAVLRHLVEAGTDLIGARYGALGVLGEDGEFTDLITTGVDAEPLLAEAGLPQSHGLLGHLISHAEPLRVDDIGADSRAVGFPSGHPVMTSLLGVPLTVRGVMYGNLYLADKEDGTPFTDTDETLLTALASAASVSIENARLYERLKRAAEQFQRRLLPVLPDLSPLRVEARYQPASDLLRLGGDWYDAFGLPDKTVLVVVGDVTGHDVEAAPQMGQIRNMLRVLAFDRCGPPGLIVNRLDRALTAFGDSTAATLLLARIEQRPDTGYVLHWTNAGHPPPLLIEHDGTARFLEEGAGLMLGTGIYSVREDAVCDLPPGSSVLFYTDGLIESPAHSLDDGLERLRREAPTLAATPLDDYCDRLLSKVRPADNDDDVALLALWAPG